MMNINSRAIINLGTDQTIYFPNYFNSFETLELFQVLHQSIQWRNDKIKMFGKIYNIPRLQAWYGENDAKYSYSNINLSPIPWTKELLEIKAKIEATCNTEFNSVLLNLYRNGTDSNGWHSDDEKELGENPIIASISLGQERIFQLKHKVENTKIDILLENGSLLLMSGTMQKNWKHQIPKTKKPLNSRINLTFRRIYT